jgi:hypothetical protein
MPWHARVPMADWGALKREPWIRGWRLDESVIGGSSTVSDR